jgi:tetratricopeptide (TPR) repeat protein
MIEEVMPVCQARGGDWYIKAIQAKGFCRWKQYRLDEALALFQEQEGIMGPSAALCENIGHTYSSIGDLEEAARYFERGLELLKAGSFGNCAGLYYGLGLIKERQGDGLAALPILGQALEMYRNERSTAGGYVDTSIVGKVQFVLH